MSGQFNDISAVLDQLNMDPTSDLNLKLSDLSQVGIYTVNDLSVALHNTENLNDLLHKSHCPQLSQSIFNKLSQLLHVHRVEEFTEMSDETVRIFVYGSLLSGLHNFGLLERNNASFYGMATTKESYFMCSRGPVYSFPFVTKEALLPNQIKCRIRGEIYIVPTSAIGQLDRLENHPIWYRRQVSI